MNSNETVMVLMSTYNGDRYLETQIESILNQQNVNVKILVRDDGSTDGTLKILKRYQDAGKLLAYGGENLKPAKSFMDLVCKAPKVDYYAFSDQDDYWLPDKLAVAVEKIRSHKNDVPCLYCSAYTMVDEDLQKISQGNERRNAPTTFKQAIASSLVAGCTMVFNHCLLDMLRIDHQDFKIMHDNWTQKVCLAVGGTLVYDDTSHIYYRQHSGNVIGGNGSLVKRLQKHIIAAVKNKCYRSDSIEVLYQAYKDYMPENNRVTCQLICEYHRGFNRLKIINDTGFKMGISKVDTMFKTDVMFGTF